MQILYRLAADAMVVVHLAYVAFVVLGLLAVLLGIAFRWQWTRNVYFRGLHLAAIGIVVAESLFGVTCPLTTWEQSLREAAGQTAYEGQFIATCVHRIMFVEAEPWVFTLCYSLFGLAVLATFFLAPPRWRRKATAAESSGPGN